MEDKRIYVVVAGTIQVGPGGKRTVIQPAGRQVAQAAHVVSKLRFNEAVKATVSTVYKFPDPKFEPITTIVLQARDSAELAHCHQLLLKKRIGVEHFGDTNPGEYGDESAYITAICTEPVKKSKVNGLIDYLPLWGAK